VKFLKLVKLVISIDGFIKMLTKSTNDNKVLVDKVH